MTPEENTIQYYRNRSLAMQAALEIMLAEVNKMKAVLEQTLSTARSYDEQFNVKADDPMAILIARLRETQPSLQDMSDEAIMKMLADNPQALNT